MIGRPQGDTVVVMSNKNKEPEFEEALEKLEELVALMESGDIALADLVEKFEEGSKLVKVCENRLKQAELRIQKLREKEDAVSLEDFSTEEE